MKKITISIILIIFTFAFTAPVLAHPGRTDKRGCHTCKTNCKKYGLKYNQYHCHRTNNLYK